MNHVQNGEALSGSIEANTPKSKSIPQPGVLVQLFLKSCEPTEWWTSVLLMICSLSRGVEAVLAAD